MSELVPLGEVGKFINGRAFKPSDWATSGLPIIRIQNLTGSTNIWNRFTGKVDPRNLVIEGDILISWSASLGVYRWKGENAVLNQHIFKVVLNEGIDDKYFFYAASNALLEMSGRVHGSTMQHITKDEFDSLRILIPSLPEQQRIAATLERADHLRRTRRFARQMSDTFLQSVFLKMFGDQDWPLVPFEDIVESAKIGLVRGADEMGADKAFAYVRMDAIVGDGDLRLANLRRVDANQKEVAENSLQPGDVLFNTRNSKELVGKSGLFTEHGVYLFNNNILRVRCNAKADPRFLIHFLQTSAARRNLEVLKSGTTNVFAIYYKDLREMPVMLPPIEKQREFAAIVQRFERLRAMQIEAERQANHLFGTLLQRAFSVD